MDVVNWIYRFVTVVEAVDTVENPDEPEDMGAACYAALNMGFLLCVVFFCLWNVSGWFFHILSTEKSAFLSFPYFDEIEKHPPYMGER